MGLIVLRILAFSCLLTLYYGYELSFSNSPHLAGDYCRIRDGESCCDGRIDACSVPIFGTLCYCDQFCNRRINPDCCPDYWRTCHGPGPLQQVMALDCLLNGEHLPNKNSTMYNCNHCTCNNGEITCHADACLIDEQLLRQFEIKASEYSWTVANYSKFWGVKLHDGLLKLTGTLHPGKRTSMMYPITHVYDSKKLPLMFDARQRWPGFISKIKDQGWCGASWAFSTISLIEDRLAIESNGLENVELSTQNLINCNKKGQQGCNGGHVERAWNYLRRRGVTTEECYKYESGENGIIQACKVPSKGDLFSHHCQVKKFPLGRKSLYTAEPSYRIASTEGDIMFEIIKNGPVQAIIRVYQDFVMYRSGIYSRRQLGFNGNYLLHSVKIIGWGEESSNTGVIIKYWLVVNSWGTTWGEDGLFRIRRGTNESDIEHYIFAARARITPLKEEYKLFSKNWIA